MKILIFRWVFFSFSGVTTGNMNHIIPLCLLLRKDKMESHESPH